MDFFNKLGSKISSGANVVASKTKEFAETTKIGMQISQDENKIKDLYAEIGKIYYKKTSENPSEEFLASFNEIATIQARVDAARTQLQKLKGTRICESCGAEIPSNVAFCGTCGVKVSVTETESPQSEIVEDNAEPIVVSVTCPSCGNVV